MTVTDMSDRMKAPKGKMSGSHFYNPFTVLAGLSRKKDPEFRTGRSVLRGRRVTALTRRLERSGYLLTMWTLGKHFRTYPEYVQDEVIGAIGDPAKFEKGPLLPSYSNPYTLTDGNLITARWPGDARRLGEVLLARIQAGGPMTNP